MQIIQASVTLLLYHDGTRTSIYSFRVCISYLTLSDVCEKFQQCGWSKVTFSFVFTFARERRPPMNDWDYYPRYPFDTLLARFSAASPHKTHVAQKYNKPRTTNIYSCELPSAAARTEN